MLRPDDVSLLRCPICRAALSFRARPNPGPDVTSAEADRNAIVKNRLVRGGLSCRGCGARFPVEDSLARLYRESEVRGNDRLLRLFYDGLPSLHDPVVRLTLPLFQGKGAGATEDEMREAYMQRIELESLQPRSDGKPLRILEVGIGTGGNLWRVRKRLPAAVPVELWGVDLSAGMISVLRKRLDHSPVPELRLLLADAHSLPFPDEMFDRVFHVGALGSMRDPGRALSEMARVAVPDSPIVVVDEQLDPAQAHTPFQRAMFRLVTFYDRRPHAPVEALPHDAYDVATEQASRFFYCLRFKVPPHPLRKSLAP